MFLNYFLSAYLSHHDNYNWLPSPIVISGLESRCKSVKQNNEGHKVMTFILWLLVNWCSVRVKQKS